MRSSALVSSVALAVASVSYADIFQYADCDWNGTLFLTEVDAEPFADLSGLYLGCADLYGADLRYAFLSGADLSGANLIGADLTGADLTGATGDVSAIVDISDLVVDQTGSCCTNSGCASISESNCSAMGGTWTEVGSCDDCQPAADDCPADVDGDGTIGFSDVLVILNDWGVCP